MKYQTVQVVEVISVGLSHSMNKGGGTSRPKGLDCTFRHRPDEDQCINCMSPEAASGGKVTQRHLLEVLLSLGSSLAQGE